jgi:hypothetical protein
LRQHGKLDVAGSNPALGSMGHALGKRTGLQNLLAAGFDSSVTRYESVSERLGAWPQPRLRGFESLRTLYAPVAQSDRASAF